MPREEDVDPIMGIGMEPEEFWAAHERRQKILDMQDVVRPGRTTPTAVRLDRFTMTRLRALAALRNTGYQTLMKEFIVERLYEEERREGIIEPGAPRAGDRPAKKPPSRS